MIRTTITALFRFIGLSVLVDSPYELWKAKGTDAVLTHHSALDGNAEEFFGFRPYNDTLVVTH